MFLCPYYLKNMFFCSYYLKKYMKKKLFATFLFLGLTLTAFGQQSMTETQILQYVMQQKKLGKSESDIATELLKKGATLEQIQNICQSIGEVWYG